MCDFYIVTWLVCYASLRYLPVSRRALPASVLKQMPHKFGTAYGWIHLCQDWQAENRNNSAVRDESARRPFAMRERVRKGRLGAIVTDHWVIL